MKEGGSDIEVIKQLNDKGVGKKIIEFKPSQQLDNLNKKRYLMISEMKPLTELYKGNSKPPQSKVNVSTLDLKHCPSSNQSDFTMTTRSRTPSKRTFLHSGGSSQVEMKSVLSYQDALPYRDTFTTGKVSETNHQALVKQTLKEAVKVRREGLSSRL